MAPLIFVNIMDAYSTLLYIEFVSKVCSLYIMCIKVMITVGIKIHMITR